MKCQWNNHNQKKKHDCNKNLYENGFSTEEKKTVEQNGLKTRQSRITQSNSYGSILIHRIYSKFRTWLPWTKNVWDSEWRTGSAYSFIHNRMWSVLLQVDFTAWVYGFQFVACTAMVCWFVLFKALCNIHMNHFWEIPSHIDCLNKN